MPFFVVHTHFYFVIALSVLSSFPFIFYTSKVTWFSSVIGNATVCRWSFPVLQPLLNIKHGDLRLLLNDWPRAQTYY